MFFSVCKVGIAFAELLLLLTLSIKGKLVFFLS